MVTVTVGFGSTTTRNSATLTGLDLTGLQGLGRPVDPDVVYILYLG